MRSLSSFTIMASLLVSFLSYFLLLPGVNIGQKKCLNFQSQRMVLLTRTLYYKLGNDLPVFPSLRSASQSVSQLASQPVMRDCLRATLHILHLGSYVTLGGSMFGLGAVISQPPLFFLCPPTVDAVDLPGLRATASCSCSPPSVSLTVGFSHCLYIL